MIWLRTLPLLLFMALALFFFHGLSLDPKLVPSSLINRPMPQFVLPILDEPSQRFSSKSLRGKPCLIHVWASWCEACQAEHVEWLKIARDRKVAIYGLVYKDAAKTVRQFLQQLGNPYQQVFLDQDGRFALDFGVYGVPETFLIDAEGIVRFRWVGALTEAKWKSELLPRVEKMINNTPFSIGP